MPNEYDIESIKRRVKKAFELLGNVPMHEIKNKDHRNEMLKAYDELFYLLKYLNRSDKSL